ncbi:hypothetical protein ACDQ55_16830 [Chitinophaga sp. 30R24]|uniref:hypothetical protein n=1 Tax=Chitinophaga sp. 30R24 TaxID=3248838 RepID=UPI003B8EFCDF
MKKSLIAAVIVMCISAASFAQAPATKPAKKEKAKTEAKAEPKVEAKQAADSTKAPKHKHAAPAAKKAA